MAYYLNNNVCYESYKYIAQMEYFVDKSEILEELFPVLNTENRFICITRPRRFGKTAAANLIASFFSRGYDSRELFSGLKIKKSPAFEEHINKHNVIFIDFSKTPYPCEDYNTYMSAIVKKLMKDLAEQYPQCGITETDTPWDALEVIRGKTGERFIFIMDEWDFVFHDKMIGGNSQLKFLRFLQNLLKSQAYVEMAYMTGILPIAKYSSGSPLNMFNEYTMADTGIARFSTCFGFTDREVMELYKKYSAKIENTRFTFQELKIWYDGYQTAEGEPVYNPRSVNRALSENHLGTYWSSTGPYDEIFFYINHNLHEVKEDIVRMVAGEWIEVSIKNFTAETMELHSREDIFSAMLVYGMLTHKDGKITIPNKELMLKYEEVLQREEMGYIAKLAKRSQEMLQATLCGDVRTMEDILSLAHDTEVPILNYNSESDLGALVNLIYLSARDNYRIEREDRAGKGFADFIFYPCNPCDPALILELKVDAPPETALEQIMEKKYAQRFKDLTGEKKTRGKVLVAALTYDRKTKQHHCAVKELDIF